MRLAILFAALASSAMAAETTSQIPMDQIWSNSAPGARPLRALEPDIFVKRDTPEKIQKFSTPEARAAIRDRAKHSLVLQIERAMGKLPTSEDQKAKKGFAVSGLGKDALASVVSVIAKGRPPVNKFTSRENISVVFFSHPFQPAVELAQVERKKNSIVIKFKMIPNPHMTISWGLSLIPMGKLPTGEYRVHMVRIPEAKKLNQETLYSVESKWEEVVVSRPFTFIVTD
jgi:hypothetical protein